MCCRKRIRAIGGFRLQRPGQESARADSRPRICLVPVKQRSCAPGYGSSTLSGLFKQKLRPPSES